MLMVLIVLGTSIWVYFDAKKIGVKKTDQRSFVNMGPVGWMVCCLLLWIVVFPLYLIKRSSLKKQFQPSSSQAAPVRPAPVPVSDVQDIDQQLRTLAKLREDGVITTEDFDRKKREILGM